MFIKIEITGVCGECFVLKCRGLLWTLLGSLAGSVDQKPSVTCGGRGANWDLHAIPDSLEDRVSICHRLLCCSNPGAFGGPETSSSQFGSPVLGRGPSWLAPPSESDEAKQLTRQSPWPPDQFTPTLLLDSLGGSHRDICSKKSKPASQVCRPPL